MRYPWQEDDWRRIVREFDSLPNAWLLTGPEGIGKVDFAYSLARALLCDTPLEDGRGCGQCESCRWLASGTHPDFRHLCPEAADEGKEEGGKSARKLSQIKIEAVREIIEFSQLTAHRHGRRVVLVEPAEKLNLAAANAILKVLEEPPDNTVFLLVADRPQRLLPTIRSRCRKFSLSRPPHEVALAWLKTQGVAHAEAELAWHGGAPVFEHDEALYRRHRRAKARAPRALPSGRSGRRGASGAARQPCRADALPGRADPPGAVRATHAQRALAA